MKIGKYPVKHSYKIARLVSDILSLGITVLIFTAAIRFIDEYRDMLRLIGKDNVDMIDSEYLADFSQGYLWVIVFPVIAVGIIAAYLVLTLKSHRFEKYNITKRNAQSVYNWYAFCVSICKIPLLMGVFDIMYNFNMRMFGEKVNLFGFQSIIDVLLILIIIRLTVHRIRKITEPEKEEEYEYEYSDGSEAVTVTLKPVDDDSKDNNDWEKYNKRR